MRAAYAYDRAQRLTEVTNTVGATTVSRHAYGLDAEGNRTVLDEFVAGITEPPLTWSEAVRVNDDSLLVTQDEPQVALSAEGTGHAVWTDARLSTGGDIFYARRVPGSLTFGPNERVSGTSVPGSRSQPAVALDAAGGVYAVWQLDKPGTSGIETDICFARRDAASGAWSSEVKVGEAARGLPGQKSPRIAVTQAGDATALWVGYRADRWEIVSARLGAGSASWGAAVNVTDGAASEKAAPDLALAPDGTAYAVWHDDRFGSADIFTASRGPTAEAWSANTKLSDEAVPKLLAPLPCSPVVLTDTRTVEAPLAAARPAPVRDEAMLDGRVMASATAPRSSSLGTARTGTCPTRAMPSASVSVVRVNAYARRTSSSPLDWQPV